MPEVDADLAQALRHAKSSPMFFAFVVKGGSDGALLVSKKAIKPDEIKAAKAKCGGSVVFRGRCFGEDGKLIFETAGEPPASLAKQIRTVAARDAGVNLQVETRCASGEMAEEEVAEGPTSPEQPTAAAAPQPSGDAATFKDRLKALMPRYQQAGRDAPDHKADFDRVAAGAAAAAKAGDFARGLLLLDGLEKVLQKVAPAPAAPAAAHDPAETASRLEKHVTEWKLTKVNAVKDLVELTRSLKKEGDPDALQVAGVVADVVKKLPTGLDDALAQLRQAVVAGAPEVPALTTRARAEVRSCMGYLSEHQFFLSCFENNPFDLPMQIQKPLADRLTAIERDLAAL